MQTLIKFYKPYLERNKTYLEFADDVNTLGGSIEDGWVSTHRQKCFRKSFDHKTIGSIPLKQIWDEFKQGQKTLF